MTKAANINIQIGTAPHFNKETEEAMREALAIERGELQAKRYKNTEELFTELGRGSET